jgi:soluble lytic murein transglycosylase-like protein
MFFICSRTIRLEKESMMRLKFVGFALVTASVCSAPPALAQEQVDAPSESLELRTIGYRVEEKTDGFQLVTHGVWKSPAPEQALAIATPIGPNPFYAPRPGPGSSKQGTSFRRAVYLPHVYAAEAQFSLPSGLLDALIWTESRYNPVAISKAGAAGLGQLMPGTARDLGVLNRFDPKENLVGAARYLRQMLDKFGVVHLAVAAYNAGPGAVERAGGIPLNGETPGYVRDVLDRWRY